MKKVITAADKLKSEDKLDDAAFLLQLLDKAVKPASNLLDAGYTSLPDEERALIRKGGKEAVDQFINDNLNKPKSRVSFKKIMKELSSTGQTLSDIINKVDSLDENETAELLNTIIAIKEDLEKAEAKVKRQAEKLS